VSQCFEELPQWRWNSAALPPSQSLRCTRTDLFVWNSSKNGGDCRTISEYSLQIFRRVKVSVDSLVNHFREDGWIAFESTFQKLFQPVVVCFRFRVLPCLVFNIYRTRNPRCSQREPSISQSSQSHLMSSCLILSLWLCSVLRYCGKAQKWSHLPCFIWHALQTSGRERQWSANQTKPLQRPRATNTLIAGLSFVFCPCHQASSRFISCVSDFSEGSQYALSHRTHTFHHCQ
jgi:hypothetical protein